MHSFTLMDMAKTLVSDILGIINKKFPFCLAEDWDNVGLQLGDPQATIERIMVALEPTEAVIDEAIQAGCQLLITHHPLLFKPLKQISATTPVGRTIIKALQGNLAVIAMHTNYDAALGGLNHILSERLGFSNTMPLKPLPEDNLLKFSIYVPESHHAIIVEALLPYTYILDNYADCTFTSYGDGTFRPLPGAQPTIGSVGKTEHVREGKLEFLLDPRKLEAVLQVIKTKHPYEAPAYEFFPVRRGASSGSIGLIARLNVPERLQDFARDIAIRLAAPGLRFSGHSDTPVQTIAFCSGSGASLIDSALRVGADVLITGDIKYHDAHHALAAGLCLIDAGHFNTEIIMVDAVASFLTQAAKKQRRDFRVVCSQTAVNPFQTV